MALGDLPARPSPDRIRLRLALALGALLVGDLQDAQGQAGDARDDARALGDRVFALAALALGALAAVAQADGPQGVQALEASSAALERLAPAELATRLPAVWMHARARRALGRPDAALADLDRGAALAVETGREHVLLVLRAEAVATLVELGRVADALQAGGEAVELARLAGPQMLVRALSALARARLAAAGERRTALEALVAAQDALDGFGALRRRDEAVRELRRLGRRVVRSAAGAGGDPLSAREREIAELLAAGRTNREVAELLVLSPRTVEAHLRAIYAKLEVRSRVELAARRRAEHERR